MYNNIIKITLTLLAKSFTRPLNFYVLDITEYDYDCKVETSFRLKK